MGQIPAWLDNVDLANMREVLEASMTQTCAITRPTIGRTKGDYSRTLVSVATGVRCRLMPGYRTGRERGDDAGNFENTISDIEHMLTVPYNTDLQRGDIVAVTGEGSKYVVIGLRWDDAEWKTCLRANVKIEEQ